MTDIPMPALERGASRLVSQPGGGWFKQRQGKDADADRQRRRLKRIATTHGQRKKSANATWCIEGRDPRARTRILKDKILRGSLHQSCGHRLLARGTTPPRFSIFTKLAAVTNRPDPASSGLCHFFKSVPC